MLRAQGLVKVTWECPSCGAANIEAEDVRLLTEEESREVLGLDPWETYDEEEHALEAAFVPDQSICSSCGAVVIVEAPEGWECGPA